MMEHLYIEKDRTQPTLLLLHGTGGDENSLVEIANFISPDSSVLGIRGRISEGGLTVISVVLRKDSLIW